jgi:hypothetical protein
VSLKVKRGNFAPVPMGFVSAEADPEKKTKKRLKKMARIPHVR